MKRGNYELQCADPFQPPHKKKVLEYTKKIGSKKFLAENMSFCESKYNLNENSYLCRNCIVKMENKINEEKKKIVSIELASTSEVSNPTTSIIEEKSSEPCDEESDALQSCSSDENEGAASSSDNEYAKEQSLLVANEVLEKCNITPHKSRKYRLCLYKISHLSSILVMIY